LRGGREKGEEKRRKETKEKEKEKGRKGRRGEEEERGEKRGKSREWEIKALHGDENSVFLKNTCDKNLTIFSSKIPDSELNPLLVHNNVFSSSRLGCGC
jgi:hypothetical protein